MDLEWQEIGWDSSNIDRIAHNGQKLYIEFKKGTGYYYDSVPYDIYVRILNKEYCDKRGNPSYGATFNILVKQTGYIGIQYK